MLHSSPFVIIFIFYVFKDCLKRKAYVKNGKRPPVRRKSPVINS